MSFTTIWTEGSRRTGRRACRSRTGRSPAGEARLSPAKPLAVVRRFGLRRRLGLRRGFGLRSRVSRREHRIRRGSRRGAATPASESNIRRAGSGADNHETVRLRHVDAEVAPVGVSDARGHDPDLGPPGAAAWARNWSVAGAG